MPQPVYLLAIAKGLAEAGYQLSYEKKLKELEELQWRRYFSAKNILGTKMEDFSAWPSREEAAAGSST